MRAAACALLLLAGSLAGQIGPAGAGASSGGSGTGPQGPRGPAGNSVLNGTGAPAATAGSDGDFYLRTDTSCLYGPKAAGAWPGACQSLIGPAGPTTPLSGLTPGALVAASSASSVGTPGANATVDASGNISANSITSTSSGTGNLTMQFGAAPANPSAGNALIYADSSTGALTCHNSSGANCMPAPSVPGTVVQTNQSNAFTTGTQDFSLAAHLLMKNGTAALKPAACTVGEVYFATDATAGQNWYFCTAANTWTQQLAGSGGGAATSLVDGASNNALVVTQGTGSIANYLNVTNAPTATNPQLTAAGSDTNVNLQLTPKGTGYVYVPTTGLITGSGSPPLVALGPSSTGGNIYGVLMTLNQPASTGGNAEYIRVANNGAWQGSWQAGNIWLATQLSVGSTASGSTGAVAVTNSGQVLTRSAGYFGIGTGTNASGIDTGLARTSAGQFEINNGSAGGAAAANMRDLKLRHTIYSGAAPTISSGTGSIAGADEAGRVTLTAAAQTSIAIAFGTTYLNAPACVANDETTATLVQAVASFSTLTLNGNFGASDKITWRCASF